MAGLVIECCVIAVSESLRVKSAAQAAGCGVAGIAREEEREPLQVLLEVDERGSKVAVTFLDLSQERGTQACGRLSGISLDETVCLLSVIEFLLYPGKFGAQGILLPLEEDRGDGFDLRQAAPRAPDGGEDTQDQLREAALDCVWCKQARLRFLLDRHVRLLLTHAMLRFG